MLCCVGTAAMLCQHSCCSRLPPLAHLLDQLLDHLPSLVGVLQGGACRGERVLACLALASRRVLACGWVNPGSEQLLPLFMLPQSVHEGLRPAFCVRPPSMRAPLAPAPTAAAALAGVAPLSEPVYVLKVLLQGRVHLRAELGARGS